MHVQNMEPFPPKSNPFYHDIYNMGTVIAENITVMHESHPTDKAKYIIVVNTETGERLKIVM